MLEQPNSTSPSPKFLYYADITADLDLIALSGNERSCRAIRCETAGVVSVVSEAGDTVAQPFKAGETLSIRCIKINDSGTGSNLGVTVFW